MLKCLIVNDVVHLYYTNNHLIFQIKFEEKINLFFIPKDSLLVNTFHILVMRKYKTKKS